MKKIIKNSKKINGFWNNLLINSFWAFLGDSFSSFINLVVTILIIKIIGDEMFGVMVVAQSYMQVMDVLINVQCWKGIIQYGQKAIAKDNIDNLYSYIRLGCMLDISTAILGGIISILFSFILSSVFNWDTNLLICSVIFSITIFFHFSGTPTAVLRILNKFKVVSYQKIISSIIKVIPLLALLFTSNKISLVTIVIIYSISDIIGNILLIIFSAYCFNKKYKLKNVFNSKLPKDKNEFIKFTLWGTLSEIVDIPVNYFDVFILSFLGNKLVAVYKVFKQITSILSKLTVPVYQAIMPQFSELKAKGMVKEGYKVVIKIRNIILKLMLPFSLLAGLTSPIWLKIIYGEIYAKYWYILLILLVFQTLALSYTTIHPYFLSLGKAKKSAIYVLIANIIYMIVALTLIKKLGMLGLAIAFFIQSFVVIYLKVNEIKHMEEINE